MAIFNLLQPADFKPVGYPNALVWKGGNHQGGLNPVAHALTEHMLCWELLPLQIY
ncbi:MAG: hypothetical protein CM1200mP3_07660 [Chloroflexota bacterium]|nr:MAG: hypothetical protein CM1200mP3_07660 [Chloroflexota bacterium]